MLWVRPEREQPCVARLLLGPLRQLRALRQSHRRLRPELRQLLYRVPLCEGALIFIFLLFNAFE